MWKLVPIYIFAIVMAYFSDRRSSYYLDQYCEKKYIKKDKLVFFIMALSLAVFVGLRTRGNDTVTYRYMYEYEILGGIEGFLSIDWLNISAAPALQLIIVCLKSIGASTQDFFMVFALFTVITYLWFIRKYSNNIVFSVFLFLIIGGYTFSMAAIKQTTAVAVLLIATDRILHNKKISFLVLVFIAELFHPYAFIYLVVPFLFFAPWTRKTWWMIAVTVLCAFGFDVFLSGIFLVTESMGYSYDSSAFSGEGVNIFRVCVMMVPVVISFLGRGIVKNNTDKVTNLVMNLTMINALIMFIGLFGTANYFARLANYFVIFQTLSIPWLIRVFKNNSKSIVVLIAVFCYLLYSVYGNVYANDTFDNQYGFITIFEYLGQLFS